MELFIWRCSNLVFSYLLHEGRVLGLSAVDGVLVSCSFSQEKTSGFIYRVYKEVNERSIILYDRVLGSQIFSFKFWGLLKLGCLQNSLLLQILLIKKFEFLFEPIQNFINLVLFFLNNVFNFLIFNLFFFFDLLLSRWSAKWLVLVDKVYALFCNRKHHNSLNSFLFFLTRLWRNWVLRN